MKRLILVRYGEIILKGLNRSRFEAKLISNIKRAIGDLGKAYVRISQARIHIEPRDDDYDIEEAVERLKKVFGIVSLSIVYKCPSDFDAIKEMSVSVVGKLFEEKRCKTFKVETKRANKKFPLKSPEISREVGGAILSNYNFLRVNVENPDFILYVEVREETFIYCNKISAFGGLPTGTNGKAMLLLSGGIDSPVACFMMAKRGLEIEATHFYSYPYTSERAKDKVVELAKKLSEYCYNLKLNIVPFTDIQVEMRDNCNEDELTIIMRRIMMDITERIAKKSDCLALITGEALGQVASQTIESLAVTNEAATMPVFRPLIGMDKEEVIAIARKIDTFETSVLPYEDCCTVFVAKHPKTKPVLKYIKYSQEKLDIEDMIVKAIDEREVIICQNGEIVDTYVGDGE